MSFHKIEYLNIELNKPTYVCLLDPLDTIVDDTHGMYRFYSKFNKISKKYEKYRLPFEDAIEKIRMSVLHDGKVKALELPAYILSAFLSLKQLKFDFTKNHVVVLKKEIERKFHYRLQAGTKLSVEKLEQLKDAKRLFFHPFSDKPIFDNNFNNEKKEETIKISGVV